MYFSFVPLALPLVVAFFVRGMTTMCWKAWYGHGRNAWAVGYACWLRLLVSKLWDCAGLYAGLYEACVGVRALVRAVKASMYD